MDEQVHAAKALSELDDLSRSLQVPAAEYVPVIPEAWDRIKLIQNHVRCIAPAASSSLSADNVRAMLRRECNAAGSIGKWARTNGITPTQVQLCLLAKHPPQPKILAALGLERVVEYRKATQETMAMIRAALSRAEGRQP